MGQGPFTAIKTARISDQVLEQLQEAILKGHYPPGEKLPSERELLETFGVSRAVVREAIRALELKGIVTVRQGPTGGAYVNELSFDHLSDAYFDLFSAGKISASELAQVRAHIEPMIARLAAGAADDEKDALRAVCAAELERSKSHAERVDRNTEVHYVLARMCGNRLFASIAIPLLRLTKEMVLVVKPAELIIHEHAGHARIVDAVCAGDGEAAARAMTDHVARMEEALVELEAQYRKRRGL